MIACIDVAYIESASPSAVAACLVFDNWNSEAASAQYVSVVDAVEPYVPGQFFRRELPPILAVLNEVKEELQIVIVDGYVQLGSKRAGLGQKLHQSLDGNVIIVGVAKKSFADNDVAVEVYRGASKRPLFVTAIGMSIEEAGNKVKSMAGKYRIPTLLKQVDRLVRDEVESVS